MVKRAKYILLYFLLLIAPLFVSAQSAITTFPYTESFDNSMGGWRTLNFDAKPEYNWEYIVDRFRMMGDEAEGRNYVHSGSNALVSWSWQPDWLNAYGEIMGEALDAKDWLVSPPIHVPNNEDIVLGFWAEAGNENANLRDKLSVLVSLDANARFNNQFVLLRTYGNLTEEFVYHEISLACYRGQTICLAFRHQEYSKICVILDDVYLGPSQLNCDTIRTYPHVESFNDAGDCWISHDSDWDGQEWGVTYLQRNYTAFCSNGSPTEDNYFLSPVYYLPPGYQYKLKWRVGQNGSKNEYLLYNIFTYTNDNNHCDCPSNYGTVIARKTSTRHDWQNEEIDISHLAGRTLRFGIQFYKWARADLKQALLLDDWTIEQIPLPDPCQPTTGEDVAQTVCKGYQWQSIVINHDTTITRNLTNHCGEDSTQRYRFNLHPTNNSSENHTACNTYEWHNQNYESSGTYLHNYTDGNSCASTDTLHLTIHPSSNSSVNHTACGAYEWHGQTYETSGSYLHNYTDANNCAATDTLHLTIGAAQSDSVVTSACNQYTWQQNGVTYTRDTIVRIPFDNGGCTGYHKLELTIRHGTFNTFDTVACDRFVWHIVQYTTDTTAIYRYNNDDYCVSADTLHLRIKLSIHTDSTATVCEPIFWRGEMRETSGDFRYESNMGPNGCPTSVILHLTVRDDNVRIDSSACDTLRWNGAFYTESDSLVSPFVSEHGCNADSVMHFTVLHGTFTSIDSNACDQLRWHGSLFLDDTTTVWNYANSAHCPSADTLHLHIRHGIIEDTAMTDCNPTQWYEHLCNHSGLFQHNYANSYGCPSRKDLHFTLANGTIVTSLQSCDSLRLHGVLHLETCADTTHFPISDRCIGDSIFNITIRHASHLTLDTTACEQFTWHGQHIAFARDTNVVLTHSYNNTENCPSVDTAFVALFHGTVTDTFAIDCQPFIWHGFDCQENCQHRYDYTNAHGCQSATTLHFSYHPQHTTDTVFACDQKYWRGAIHTNDTTEVDYYRLTDNCIIDSSYTLRIVHSIHNVVNDTACESRTWNGSRYSRSGVYTYDYLPTFEGVPDNLLCPSTDTLYLTIGGTHRAFTDTACISYHYQGQQYSTTGDYIYNYNDALHCPSDDTLHLTIWQVTNTTQYDTACGSLRWNGTRYTASGRYGVYHTDAHGCINTDSLFLNIYPSVSQTIHQRVCDTFVWYGTTYRRSTVQLHQQIDSLYCLHIDTLRLTVSAQQVNAEQYDACDSFLWHGTTYTTPGTYHYREVSAEGCPVEHTLYLTIRNASHTSEPHSACDSFLLDGHYLYTSGTYESPFTNAQGCPSLKDIILTIRQSTRTDESLSPCERYTFNGRTYTANTGNTNVTETLRNNAGCDSIVALHLNFRRNTTATEFRTACDSFPWIDGITHYASGTFPHTIPNAQGCDSIISLQLHIAHAHNHITPLLGCEYLFFNGTNYTYDTAFTYPMGLTHEGCDSIEVELISIGHHISVTDSIVACNSFTWFNGHSFTSSGTDSATVFSQHGCDSTVYLHLTIVQSGVRDTFAIACDRFSWHGTTFTSSTVHRHVNQTIGDCQSIEVLHLQLGRNTQENYTVSGCDSAEWNGQWFTQNDTLVEYYRTSEGCDSTVRTIIKIGHTTYGNQIEEDCDSYTWRGTTYYESTSLPRFTRVNRQGCDSIISLDIRIYHSEETLDTIRACQTYFDGHTRYFENQLLGPYHSRSIHGCDSISRIQLLIQQQAGSGSEAVVSCDYYIFPDGNAIYHSIDTTLTLPSIFGCDSTVALKVNVTPSTFSIDSIHSCDHYVWYGDAYSATTTVEKNVATEGECPRVVRLTIIIDSSRRTDTTIVSDNAIEWDGQYYYASGDYNAKYTAANGCDSISVLHLTVASLTFPVIFAQNDRMLLLNHYPDGVEAGRVDYFGYRWYKDSTLIANANADSYSSSGFTSLNGCFYLEAAVDELQQIWLPSNVVCLGNNPPKPEDPDTSHTPVDTIGPNNPVAPDTPPDSVATDFNISVYPSPARAGEMLHLECTVEDATVDVFDVLGRKVTSVSSIGTANSKYISLTIAHPGAYIIRVTTPDESVQTYKIIVQ